MKNNHKISEANTFFSIFILKTCRALKRWGKIRILLRRFSLLFISSSSLLYLLGVQKVRSCFWSWVWNYLVLLIGWIIYLIPINNISLFLSSLLLLFILFIRLINDPHPVLDPHSSNFNSTRKLLKACMTKYFMLLLLRSLLGVFLSISPTPPPMKLFIWVICGRYENLLAFCIINASFRRILLIPPLSFFFLPL